MIDKILHLYSLFEGVLFTAGGSFWVIWSDRFYLSQDSFTCCDSFWLRLRFFTCDLVKLFTWCDCNLYVYDVYLESWNHTSQSHRMGVEPIHVRCHTQKSIAVAPCEQYHLPPHNLLHAIKKRSRIHKKSYRVDEPLNTRLFHTAVPKSVK